MPVAQNWDMGITEEVKMTAVSEVFNLRLIDRKNEEIRTELETFLCLINRLKFHFVYPSTY